MIPNSILKKYYNQRSNIQLFAEAGTHMQIDATMGVTAGISEMLVQSQQRKIMLLPALPDEWSNGTFNRAMVRGALQIDMHWKIKKLFRAT